jgi:flagellar basal body-associated protein FliL
VCFLNTDDPPLAHRLLSWMSVMAEAEKAEKNQALPKGAATRSPNWRNRVLVGAALLLGLGFGVWWMFLRPLAVKQAHASAGEGATAILPLESFTVNLADQENGRFLRVTLSLGVDGELPAAPKGEGKGPESGAVSMATIRDAILTVLAQRNSGDLLTPGGKSKLKMDLLAARHRDVAALQAREVYVTEFLVQR